MIRSEIESKLTNVFRETFNQPALQLSPSLTADDVEGWDSLSHINLIVAVEQEFGFSFATREVRSMKNVGDLIDLIAKKTG